MTGAINASLPRYVGDDLVSAAKAAELMTAYEPGSVVAAFTRTLSEHTREYGLDDLSPGEAGLAALDILTEAVANDGFASVFYNETAYLEAMLSGAELIGAGWLEDVFDRAFAALGFDEASSEKVVQSALRRLLDAHDMSSENFEEESDLVEKFQVLEEEVNIRWDEIYAQMAGLVMRSHAEFKRYP